MPVSLAFPEVLSERRGDEQLSVSVVIDGSAVLYVKIKNYTELLISLSFLLVVQEGFFLSQYRHPARYLVKILPLIQPSNVSFSFIRPSRTKRASTHPPSQPHRRPKALMDNSKRTLKTFSIY